MSYGVLNVGNLRKAIADLPDNATLLLSVNCGREDAFETAKTGYGTRFAKTVIVWGDKYQTREVRNAYRANDDRYGGPVLLIEVGDLSD